MEFNFESCPAINGTHWRKAMVAPIGWPSMQSPLFNLMEVTTTPQGTNLVSVHGHKWDLNGVLLVSPKSWKRQCLIAPWYDEEWQRKIAAEMAKGRKFYQVRGPERWIVQTWPDFKYTAPFQWEPEPPKSDFEFDWSIEIRNQILRGPDA